MKIVNKLPKVDMDKEKELLSLGWNKLKEPRSIVSAMIFSIPLLFICASVVVFLIKGIAGLELSEFGINDGSINISINIFVVVYYFILVYLHEILHLICIPNFLKSKNTFLGFSWFGGFAYTEEKISRNRYVLTAVTPFLVISIIMPLVFNIFSGLTLGLKIVAILNGASCSVDFLNCIMILMQVPRGSSIILNGNSTYYK